VEGAPALPSGLKGKVLQVLESVQEMDANKLFKLTEILLSVKKTFFRQADVTVSLQQQGGTNAVVPFKRVEREKSRDLPVKVDLIVAGLATLALIATRKCRESQIPIIGYMNKALGTHVPQDVQFYWNNVLVPLGAKEVKPPSLVSLHFKKILCALIAAIIFRRLALIWWRNHKSPIGASMKSKFISATLTHGPLDSSQLRDVFVNTQLVRSKGVVATHTHGVSAANRSAGSATAQFVAGQLGLEPYFLQMSANDVRKGRTGDRSYYWAKDLAVNDRPFSFDHKTQACVLIDVDHYLQMPDLLARHPGVYLIYTFQPSTVATSKEEYQFRFLTDQRVLYTVSGGAKYCHHVWDYSGDTLLVDYSAYLKKHICAYHIDRKRVDDHHCLIMLSLVGTYVTPVGVPTEWLLDGDRLQRLEPVLNNHACMDIVTPEGQFRSIAVVGDYNSVTLPRDQFDAVHAVAMNASVTITAGMVSSNVGVAGPNGMPKDKLPPGHAAILTSYLRAGVPASPPIVYSSSACVLPIYFSKHDYDAPVPLKGFGSPIVGPCYEFVKSIASDDRCIKGRIEKFQDTNEDGNPVEADIPPSLAELMDAFVKLAIPIPATGEPVDEEYVMDKQDRPSQRRLLAEAALTGDFVTTTWAMFCKTETYEKPTDPRPISQAPPTIKRDYSQFMYAFHNDVMANMEWYAFNKTPRECAERLAERLKTATHCTLADGSRYDGHVKRRARVLERMLMVRHFHPKYWAELNELMDKQIGQLCRSAYGRAYYSGYARFSGSLETSDLNSMLCAFIDFCAWCNTLRDGRKLTHEEAWDMLLLYGGDDSVSGPVDPEALKIASEMMGQEYEIEVYARGEMGVNFLNRQFGPDLWEGSPDSMCNPARALCKWYVGPATLPKPIDRYAERASGQAYMDSNTPVIGQLCRIAVDLLGDRGGMGELAPFDARFPKKDNWPNEPHDWMLDMFVTFLPDFDFPKFDAYIDDIRQCRDIEKAKRMLLQAPLCTATTAASLPVKTACVVGDDMHVPGDPLFAEIISIFDSDNDDDDKISDEDALAQMVEIRAAAERIEALQARAAEMMAKISLSQSASSFEEVHSDSVSSVSSAESLVKASGKYPKTTRKESKKELTGKSLDPKEWTPPKQWEGETAEEFSERHKAWKKNRDRLIQKLAIKQKAVAKATKSETLVKAKAAAREHAAKHVPAAPLVGIEPNPGPCGFCLRRIDVCLRKPCDSRALTTQVNASVSAIPAQYRVPLTIFGVHYAYCPQCCRANKIVLHITNQLPSQMLDEAKHTLSSHPICVCQCDSMIALAMIVDSQVVNDRVTYLPPAPPLVGIEPNPGPPEYPSGCHNCGVRYDIITAISVYWVPVCRNCRNTDALYRRMYIAKLGIHDIDLMCCVNWQLKRVGTEHLERRERERLRSAQCYVPSAPSLVGIETNPGPYSCHNCGYMTSSSPCIHCTVHDVVYFMAYDVIHSIHPLDLQLRRYNLRPQGYTRLEQRETQRLTIAQEEILGRAQIRNFNPEMQQSQIDLRVHNAVDQITAVASIRALRAACKDIQREIARREQALANDDSSSWPDPLPLKRVGVNRRGNADQDAIGMLGAGSSKGDGPKAAAPKAAVKARAPQPAAAQQLAVVHKRLDNISAKLNKLATPVKATPAQVVAKAVTNAMKNRPTGDNREWRTIHGGVPVLTHGGHGGKELHAGHAATRMMGDVLCVKGTERLGSLGVAAGATYNAGDTMEIVNLNPPSFGVRLPLLAIPYAQFEFTKVKLHYVGLISEANAEANGGIFFGYNKDPDSPTPQGSNGLDAISTWGKNVTLCPVFNESKFLDVNLEKRENNEPLYVDSSDDQRFSSQGTVVALAAQSFANGTGEDINFGQWFIEYEVKLFEINQPSALANCLAGAGVNLPQTSNLIILPDVAALTTGIISNWFGDSSLTTAIPQAVYGGNLMLNRDGVYVIHTLSEIPTAYQFTGVVGVHPITDCVISDSADDGVTTGTFLDGYNPGGNNIAVSNAVGANVFTGISGGHVSGTATDMMYQSFVVQAKAGAVVNIISATTTSGQVDFMSIYIQRITQNITDDFVPRGSPQQVGKDGKSILTANQTRQLLKAKKLQKGVVPPDLKIALYKLCAKYRDGDPEAHYVNILNRCFELGIPLLQEDSTQAAHPAMSVILWLVKTLGPIVASKMLGVATAKLESWIHGKK